MLKKTITYTNFDEEVVSEDFFFHLSKVDLVEMEVAQKGGMQAHLMKIVKDGDGKIIMSTFKEFILRSYGQKSDDGRRFIKTPELTEEFQQTAAFDSLFMELCTNAESAAEFANGIIPGNLQEDLDDLKIKAEKVVEEAKQVNTVEGKRVITKEELEAMTREEYDAAIVLLGRGQVVLG